MGRNIDLTELGIIGLSCPICNCNVDYTLNEVDMDCDIKSHKVNQFEVYVMCHNCDNEIKVVCDIKVNTERA